MILKVKLKGLLKHLILMVGTYLGSHCSFVQVLQILAQTLEFVLTIVVVLKKTQVLFIQLLGLLQAIKKVAATILLLIILLQALDFVLVVHLLPIINLPLMLLHPTKISLHHYLLIDHYLQLRHLQGINLRIKAVSLQYNQNSHTHCIFSCLSSYLRLAIRLTLLQQ